MVDMQQSDSAKISNKVLADRMKQLKQGKEFVTMCKEIERFENEVTVKVASEERINAVKTLLSCGLDDKTITAKMAVQYNIPEEEVRTYIAKARGNQFVTYGRSPFGGRPFLLLFLRGNRENLVLCYFRLRIYANRIQ